MRQKLLSWFARQDLLLTSATVNDLDGDPQIIVRSPLIALSRSDNDFYECPDPGPEADLETMTLDDLHGIIYPWLEKTVEANKARCFVCNKLLSNEKDASPWDAVFVTNDLICWLLVHFDCKRYLNRDVKGRNPFEVSSHSLESLDLTP